MVSFDQPRIAKALKGWLLTWADRAQERCRDELLRQLAAAREAKGKDGAGPRRLAVATLHTPEIGERHRADRSGHSARKRGGNGRADRSDERRRGRLEHPDEHLLVERGGRKVESDDAERRTDSGGDGR